MDKWEVYIVTYFPHGKPTSTTCQYSETLIYNLHMGRRKFTGDQVRDIRSSDLSARALADQYEVSHRAILDIKTGRTYKHVPDLPDDPDGSDTRGTYERQHLVNAYHQMRALEFLRDLPTGYCETITTSPPPRIGGASIKSPEEAAAEYVSWMREVVNESLRVAGSRGVVVMHQAPTLLSSGNESGMPGSGKAIDTKLDIARGFPLRKLIVWTHRDPKAYGIGSWTNSNLSPSYSFLLVFSGDSWEIPGGSLRWAETWGDVWDITPDYVDGPGGREPWLCISSEVADRCVAMGRGIVCDPFAGTGPFIRASIKAGREWIACDVRDALIREFFRSGYGGSINPAAR